MDMLPVALSGAVADIREIRCREIFNYALYDQPQVVREVVGFGSSMDRLHKHHHQLSPCPCSPLPIFLLPQDQTLCLPVLRPLRP